MVDLVAAGRVIVHRLARLIRSCVGWMGEWSGVERCDRSAPGHLAVTS